MLTSFLHSISREMRFLRHGYWNLSLVTWVPLLAIFFAGWLFTESAPRQLPLIVVDAGNSATSRKLVRNLQALPAARVVDNIRNLEEMREAIRRREAYAAVFIPPDAELDILRGNQTRVYAFFNNLYYTSANIVFRDVSAAVAQFNTDLAGARAGANRAVNTQPANGPPVSVQATLLFNAANSYQWGLGSSLIPAVLLVIMAGVVTVSLVREMQPNRRASWLADAGGRLALAIIAKVFLYSVIFTALGTLGILWLRVLGWPVNGSMAVLVPAQFLLFLANGFAMAVTVGIMRGSMLPALSIVSIYTGAGIAFGDILFPLNQSSWFTKLVSAIMPYTTCMQVQAQQMQMGSPPADSLGFLCSLGVFALVCCVAGFLLIRSVMKTEHAGPRPEKLEPFGAHGAGGKGFMRGVRMVWWAVKNEPGVFLTLIAATVIYSFYYPSAYAAQVSTHLPVAVVDLDNSAQSRNLIRKVMMMRAVDVVERPASLADARRLVERREADGIMLIGENFGRDALTGRTGRIAIYGNNAFLVRSAVLLGALGEAATEVAMEIMEPQLLRAGIASGAVAAAAAPAQIVARPLFNTRDGYGSFVVPAAEHLIVHQAMFFGIMMVLGRRRQRAAESGLPLPAMPAGMFSGTFATFFLMGLANSLWINGYGYWLHDYPRGGNTAGMLVFMLAYVWAVVGGSMLIGSFIDRTERALQFFVSVSVPLFFLTGISWPVESMPGMLRWLSQLIPVVPGVSGFAKLHQMGATLAEARSEMLHLMTMGAVFTSLAWLRLGRGHYLVAAQTAATRAA